jgi:hypothetical protein
MTESDYFIPFFFYLIYDADARHDDPHDPDGPTGVPTEGPCAITIENRLHAANIEI